MKKIEEVLFGFRVGKFEAAPKGVIHETTTRLIEYFGSGKAKIEIDDGYEYDPEHIRALLTNRISASVCLSDLGGDEIKKLIGNSQVLSEAVNKFKNEKDGFNVKEIKVGQCNQAVDICSYEEGCQIQNDLTGKSSHIVKTFTERDGRVSSLSSMVLETQIYNRQKEEEQE